MRITRSGKELSKICIPSKDKSNLTFLKLSKMNVIRKSIFFFLLALILSSCIKRLVRPNITGRILDYDGKPIENCMVGETKTDPNGYFHLSAKTYNAFLLTEIFAMEAPPMMVGFEIKKNGYVDDNFESFHKYGGGLPKDTKWDLGDIYLRLKRETVDVTQIFKDRWKMSFSKSKDTMYLVSQKLEHRNLTERSSELYSLYDQLTSDYGKSDSLKKVFPIGVGSREIKLQIQDKNLEIDVLTTYMIRDKKDDSIRYSGVWNLAKDSVMTFKTSYKDLNGNFKVLKSDLFFLQLKKL